MSKKIKLFFLLLILLNLSPHFAFAQNKKIDSLFSHLHSSGSQLSDTGKINTLNILAWELRFYNPDTSITLSLNALKLANSIIGSYSGSINLAGEDSRQLVAQKGIAQSYQQLGWFNYLKGNYLLSIDYEIKALDIWQQLENYFEIKNGIEIPFSKLLVQKFKSRSLSNIGVVYAEKSDYPKALDYFFKALKIKNQLGNENEMPPYLANIGNVYEEQHDYNKALDYYFQALKIVEKSGEKNQIAIYTGNIGISYGQQADVAMSNKDVIKGDSLYKSALGYFFKALKLNEELGNTSGIARNIGSIGIIYQNQGNFSKALENYFKVLKISEELDDKYLTATWLTNIGNIYGITKNYKQAEEYQLKALALSTKINALGLIEGAQKYLSELYSKMDQPAKAFEHYKKYIAAKDSIFNEENTKKTVRSEMNFEFEKKQAITAAEQEKKNTVEAKEKQKQKIIMYAVSTGLFLVLLLALFIFRGYKQKQKSNYVITQQKELVEQKNKEITDSIKYAKHIQTALLTSSDYIKNNLPAEHFILYKPKDIVSGDFYWAHSIPFLPGWDLGTNKVRLPVDGKRTNTFYMVTADCTGHGVPGAFMSMLNISYLHENIVERGIRLPHDILNAQRKEIIQALNPEGSIEESKDGMDCNICVYDFDKMLLHFSAANIPLWLVRNGELAEYKADKMPVGKYNEKLEPFTLKTIALQKGDVIYTSTDGFADQFGLNGKKLMKKIFKEELLKIHQTPMAEQKQNLDQFFKNWKGSSEQVDDVLVIGVRI